MAPEEGPEAPAAWLSHVDRAVARGEITVLFADLVAFSTFCQVADPLEVQRVLAEVLERLTQAVTAARGRVDKYLGDGLMARFGDAHTQDEAAIAAGAGAAVRAGLEMQVAMVELRGGWLAGGRPAHQLRVGIHTGPATVGQLGTATHPEETAIGHTVNLAKRLEGAAPPGGLLLGKRTAALAAGAGRLPRMATQVVTLKGAGDVACVEISARLVALLVVAARGDD